MADRRADWLADHLDAPDLVIVDGTWFLPPLGRDAKTEYLEGHIPGAVFFDVDEIADTASGLPHTLASPVMFSSTMRKLGIGGGQRIVVYDTLGIFSAVRVWWNFKVMGVEDITLLNGGLLKWKAEERPLEEGMIRRQERHFTARLDSGAVRDADDVKRALETGSAQVVDARPADRFRGEAPEPPPRGPVRPHARFDQRSFPRPRQRGRNVEGKRRAGRHLRCRRDRHGKAGHNVVRLRGDSGPARPRAKPLPATVRSASTTAPGPSGDRGKTFPSRPAERRRAPITSCHCQSCSII